MAARRGEHVSDEERRRRRVAALVATLVVAVFVPGMAFSSPTGIVSGWFIFPSVVLAVMLGELLRRDRP